MKTIHEIENWLVSPTILSGKKRLGMAFAWIFLVLLLNSCDSSSSSAREFELKVETQPEKWKAGELVEVKIHSISHTDELTSMQPTISMPFINFEHMDFGDGLVTVQWKTDSFPYLAEDKRDILIIGDFQGTKAERAYSLFEKYKIKEDAEHWYSLEKDMDFHKIDTFDSSYIYEP